MTAARADGTTSGVPKVQGMLAAVCVPCRTSKAVWIGEEGRAGVASGLGVLAVTGVTGTAGMTRALGAGHATLSWSLSAPSCSTS